MPDKRASERVGQGLIYLVALLLAFDGVMQLLSPPFMLAAMAETGFSLDAGPLLATVTLTCALILAIPRTATLGAILVTGFLGGAISVHVRIGEIGSPPQLICILLGIAVWTGLYLREPRLRELLPVLSGSMRPRAAPRHAPSRKADSGAQASARSPTNGLLRRS